MRNRMLALLTILSLFLFLVANDVSCNTPVIESIEGNSQLEDSRYFKNGIIVHGENFGTLPKVELISEDKGEVIQLKVILDENISSRIEAVFPEYLKSGEYDIKVTNQEKGTSALTEDYKV